MMCTQKALDRPSQQEVIDVRINLQPQIMKLGGNQKLITKYANQKINEEKWIKRYI